MIKKNINRKILIYIYRKIYIINNLKIKILIRNNILKSKKIIINIIR